MNLTIEQMRKIVDGAPAIANFYIPSKAGYTRMGSVLLDGAISLNDLHAAIADHDRTAIAEHESKMHSHLTSGVFQDDDHTDHVTDIRNHISPNTRVSEAHVNEAFKLNRLG